MKDFSIKRSHCERRLWFKNRRVDSGFYGDTRGANFACVCCFYNLLRMKPRLFPIWQKRWLVCSHGNCAQGEEVKVKKKQHETLDLTVIVTTDLVGRHRRVSSPCLLRRVSFIFLKQQIPAESIEVAFINTAASDGSLNKINKTFSSYLCPPPSFQSLHRVAVTLLHLLFRSAQHQPALHYIFLLGWQRITHPSLPLISLAFYSLP